MTGAQSPTVISTTGKIHQTYLTTTGRLLTVCTNYPVPVDGNGGWAECLTTDVDHNPERLCRRCFG